MCDVPLDVQRKFERRWGARFAQPAPKEQNLKGRINTLPPLPNPKEKPVGLKRRACNLHHRCARGPEAPPIACCPAIVCSRAESDMSLPAMIHTRGKGRGFTPPRPTPD